MANLIVSGQMIRNGTSAGPMFQIFTNSDLGDGPYHARVISQLCGTTLAESYTNEGPSGQREGFKTVGEAMEWCHEFIDW